MRSHPPRPLSRRTILAVGLAGMAVLATGCGVRLDRDPELPELAVTDKVRNQLVRILAATRVDGEDAEALKTFQDALGPEWQAPTELTTELPTPEPARDFDDALTACVDVVIANFSALTGGTAGTLIDIAVGATLLLGSPKELAAALLDPPFTAPTAAPTGGDSGDGTSKGSDNSGAQTPGIAQHPLRDYALACFQASYGYERLAVHLDKDSDYGGFVRERVDSLALSAAEAVALLTNMPGQRVPVDQPAWELAIDPVDEDSARALAVSLEDAVTTPLATTFAEGNTPGIPWFANDEQVGAARAIATSGLYNSGLARKQAGSAQLLRFATTTPTPTEEP